MDTKVATMKYSDNHGISIYSLAKHRKSEDKIHESHARTRNCIPAKELVADRQLAKSKPWLPLRSILEYTYRSVKAVALKRTLQTSCEVCCGLPFDAERR